MIPRVQPVTVDVSTLEKILRLAFSGRRKRLSNALKSLDIDWSKTQLDPGLRADSVSTQDFVALVSVVNDSSEPGRL